MRPEIFVAYSLLLRNYNTDKLITLSQSKEAAERVGYQIIVMTALKNYKDIGKQNIDKMLNIPEDWAKFVGEFV